MLSGCDISSYQSSIPGGQQFVVLKATEGTGWTDQSFAGWWRTLGSRNALRGAYAFFHPGEDPIAQADHFVSVVEAAGLREGDTLWLDHESLSLASEKRTILPRELRLRMDAELTAGSVASAAQRFCARVVEKTGRCGVYTYESFAWSGNCAGLGKYALWIADPSSPKGRPRVPGPWSSWALHQYDITDVDMDVFNGTPADWLALGGGHPAPDTTEDDMPSGQLLNGQGAITPISLAGGRYKAVGFLADNGLQGLPPAKIRVAAHHSDGSGWSVTELTVDSAAKGKPGWLWPHPETVDGLSVKRLDKGDLNIGWDVS
jgi:lysozyme